MVTIGAGRYQLDTEYGSVLGRGGMGVVYRGVDTTDQRPVAIKQLKPEIFMDNAELVQRFAREAEALRLLNHPSIVTIEALLQETDTYYLVMEYVSGGSLYDELRRTPQMPIERVLNIALDIADALTRAHRLRIIHRDIKPANVLIADDGTPRLTDFGVAHMDAETNITQTGAVVGTLNYISPQALNGMATDEREDIWAFGVMLYEMLSGRRPFDGETTGELVTNILSNTPPDLLTLRPDCPPALARLIERMLQKDHELRIDSIRKVGTELENIIRGVDSDNITLDKSLLPEVDTEESRFETLTPVIKGMPRPITEPKVGDQMLITISDYQPNHPFATVTDETGEEFIVMPKRYGPRLVLPVVMFLIVGIAIGLLVRGLSDTTAEVDASISDSDNTMSLNTSITPTAIANNTLVSAITIPEGQYMVLLAQLDQRGKAEQDVYPFILEDLKETFEQDITFSNIIIQPYDEVINNSLNAREVAQATGAAVVVWGHYDEEDITLNVQVGSLEAFPYNTFSYEAIARVSNHVIRINDPHTETAAASIVGVLGVMHFADGDFFEFMRTLALANEFVSDDNVPAAFHSGRLSRHSYEYFAQYLVHTPASVEAMNEALREEGSNAILYGLRALALLRVSQNTEDADETNNQDTTQQMTRDIHSAALLSDDSWAIPAYLRAANDAFHNVETMTIMRPDDWFFYFLLGTTRYDASDYEGAREAIDKALANEPEANFPYIVAFQIALHQGRMRDAAHYMSDMIREIPDPYFGNRILAATFSGMSSAFGAAYSAAALLPIGQYQTAIDITDPLVPYLTLDSQVLNKNVSRSTIADIHFARGLAFCGIGDLDAAEAAYQMALEFDPNFKLMYLMMSELHTKRGDTERAMIEAEKARGLSDDLDAFIEVATNGDVTCDTFFAYFINN